MLTGAGLAVLMLLAVALLVPSPSRAEESPAGHVTAVEGNVAILRDGESHPATVEEPLRVGDQVVTGEAGTVVIALRGGGTLTAGPSSRFDVSEYSRDGGDDRGFFEMLVGIVRASLAPDHPWDQFEVRGRTAVASARGTDFVVEATALNTAVLTVTGRVDVASTAPGASGDEVVILEAGEGTDVARGAAPTPPAMWGEARVRDVLARTTLR
ncbi:FecR family protein [Roseospira marina]|nr:FecR family protein [Roseospira marina]